MSIAISSNHHAPANSGAQALRRYAEELFLGFSIPAEIIQRYNDGDALFALGDGENDIEFFRDGVKAYHTADEELLPLLTEFIRNAPGIFRNDLQRIREVRTDLGPKQRHFLDRVEKEIAEFERDFFLGQVSIGSMAFRHHSIVLAIRSATSGRAA